MPCRSGFSPTPLLSQELREQFPQLRTIAPQVLALANRLVPKLGGAEKTLRATRPEGPAPELRGFDSPEDEGAWVLSRVRAHHAEGVPYEDMAVLMRLNARSVRANPAASDEPVTMPNERHVTTSADLRAAEVGPDVVGMVDHVRREPEHAALDRFEGSELVRRHYAGPPRLHREHHRLRQRHTSQDYTWR